MPREEKLFVDLRRDKRPVLEREILVKAERVDVCFYKGFFSKLNEEIHHEIQYLMDEFRLVKESH